MIILENILLGLVAFLHLYFFVLEMFLWDKPLGLKTFGHTQEFALSTRIMMMNQGLYNGFLAAGLIWGLYMGTLSGHSGDSIKIFFLTCIIIAGIIGGITVSRKIFLIQALPAIFALLLVLLR